MLAGVLDSLLDALGDLGPGLLHLAVAGLAFAETALFLDILVPGEVGMVLAGAAAERSDIGVVGLIAAGAAGAVLGDSVSYALGRATSGSRLGRRATERLGTKMERAESFFDRRGGLAVFFGRWVGALRAVIPFVAGAAGMPYGRFLAWNVAASIGWVSTVILLGWTFGDAVADTVERAGGWVSAGVVGVLVAVVVYRKVRGRARGR